MEKCNKCIDDNGDWEISKCVCYDEIFINQRPMKKETATSEAEAKDAFLSNACHKNMIEWNLNNFKSSHPSLYKSITIAMESYATHSKQKLLESVTEEVSKENIRVQSMHGTFSREFLKGYASATGDTIVTLLTLQGINKQS